MTKIIPNSIEGVVDTLPTALDIAKERAEILRKVKKRSKTS